MIPTGNSFIYVSAVPRFYSKSRGLISCCWFSQVVVREVGRLRPISEYVFPAAESLLASTEAAPEKEEFESRVLATRTLWDGVRHRSDNRHVVIERVFPLAQNYDDAFRSLNVWLKETEQKVINLAPVPCDTVSLDNQYGTLTVSIPVQSDLAFSLLILRNAFIRMETH